MSSKLLVLNGASPLARIFIASLSLSPTQIVWCLIRDDTLQFGRC